MFKLIRLQALFVLLWSSVVVADDAARPQLPPKEKFHLFLLVGQSNMAGRGKVSKEDKTPHPRVLMLNKENKWVPAVDPLHFDKTAAGTGLGKTFGILVAESDPEIVVGLIPCAVGGTPISKWEVGAYDDITKTHPWDDAIKRAEIALRNGTLKGILWHQGEGDCNPERAAVYQEKLTELIQRFRSVLHAEHVPFIAGQLGQFPQKPWTPSAIAVDAAIKKTAETVPDVSVVSSAGLLDKGDNTHFNAEAYREFGKRYAEAYLKKQKKEDQK